MKEGMTVTENVAIMWSDFELLLMIVWNVYYNKMGNEACCE